MLGLQPSPTVIEALVYVLYAVPMALYVLWPDRLRRRRRQQPRRRPPGRARREPGLSPLPELPMTPISRRRLLASAGIGAAGIGIGGGGYLVGQDSAEASGEGTGSVPFYGEHQAGIDTPAQDRLHFASFDLLTESRAELRELMREWTLAAAEMTAGEMIGDVNDELLAPPDDTGETVGLLPSNLTVTFGFGPSLFERRGLGLAAQAPGGAAARSRRCPATSWTRSKAAATSASRPAPTTPRSPSTRSATWPGSAAARWRCAGPSSASAAPPAPAAARTRRAT